MAVVAVIGGGYVGLVTAAGLASLGHLVRVGERDTQRVDALRKGRIPIFEPGLERLVAKGDRGRLAQLHRGQHRGCRRRRFRVPHPSHAVAPRRERRYVLRRVGDRTIERSSRHRRNRGAQVDRSGWLHPAIPGDARPWPAGCPGGEQPRVPPRGQRGRRLPPTRPGGDWCRRPRCRPGGRPALRSRLERRSW